MQIVVSCRVRVHETARIRFDKWLRHYGHTYGDLKAELESARGHPFRTTAVGKGRWMWSFGETFVIYVLKDQPVAAGPLQFFVSRLVVITDIFAV